MMINVFLGHMKTVRFEIYACKIFYPRLDRTDQQQLLTLVDSLTMLSSIPGVNDHSAGTLPASLLEVHVDTCNNFDHFLCSGATLP